MKTLTDPSPMGQAVDGHAILIHAALNDKDGKLWFHFKNSWGQYRWVRNADPQVVSDAPYKGFGAISAEFANEYVWELYAPGDLI